MCQNILTCCLFLERHIVGIFTLNVSMRKSNRYTCGNIFMQMTRMTNDKHSLIISSAVFPPGCSFVITIDLSHVI